MTYRKSEQRRIDDLEGAPGPGDGDLCGDCMAALGHEISIEFHDSDEPIEVTERLCPRCHKVYTDPLIIRWQD